MYILNSYIFADNLKKYRVSRNLTLEALGKLVNKTKATISKYENGEIIPDIITALELCNALGISLSQLLPMERSLHDKSNGNPFNSDIVYMYYYTENKLISSVLEIFEEDNEIKVKYYNGIKDMLKYTTDVSYVYEGYLECDKTVGYINLINSSSKNTQLEKIQISFNIPWTKNFEITNFFILALSPNSIPIIKKGIISIYPIKNAHNFDDDLKISKEDLIKFIITFFMINKIILKKHYS